jgi:hypothetical protein
MAYDLTTPTGLKSAKRCIAERSDEALQKWLARIVERETSIFYKLAKIIIDPWGRLVEAELNRCKKEAERKAAYAANKAKQKQKKRKGGTYYSRR